MGFIKKYWLLWNILIIISIVLFYCFYAPLNQTSWGVWVVGIIITLMIFISMFFTNKITEEEKEKIKEAIKPVAEILGIIAGIVGLSGGVFLGMKFNNFWWYVVAAIGFYVLMRQVIKFRKKIFNINRNSLSHLNKNPVLPK